MAWSGVVQHFPGSIAAVVTSAGPDPTLRPVHGDLDLTELSIFFRIAGDIGNTVKVAHFLGDLGKGGIQVGEISGCAEGSSTRGFR